MYGDSRVAEALLCHAVKISSSICRRAHEAIVIHNRDLLAQPSQVALTGVGRDAVTSKPPRMGVRETAEWSRTLDSFMRAASSGATSEVATDYRRIGLMLGGFGGRAVLRLWSRAHRALEGPDLLASARNLAYLQASYGDIANRLSAVERLEATAAQDGPMGLAEVAFLYALTYKQRCSRSVALKARLLAARSLVAADACPDSERIVVCNSAAYVAYALGDWRRALDLLSDSLDRCTSSTDHHLLLRCQCLANSGRVYFKTGLFSESMERYEEAWITASRIADPRLRARCLADSALNAVTVLLAEGSQPALVKARRMAACAIRVPCRDTYVMKTRAPLLVGFCRASRQLQKDCSRARWLAMHWAERLRDDAMWMNANLLGPIPIANRREVARRLAQQVAANRRRVRASQA